MMELLVLLLPFLLLVMMLLLLLVRGMVEQWLLLGRSLPLQPY
jgi:hypothetical protein